MADQNTSNRGFASMDEEKRKEIASKGGKAQHDVRGLQGADKQTREEVASEGGKAHGQSDNQ